MAETPLDLSKLPCPQGCRWERIDDRRIWLFFGTIKIGCLLQNTVDGLWAANSVHGWIRFEEGTAEEAASGMLAEFGLTPAPQGRTFTEAEAALIAKKGFNEGRMFETMTRNHFGAVEPTPEQIITAALAAATDAGKETGNG